MIPWLFVLVLLAGMLVHLALGLFSRRFRPRPVQLPFEILMYICAVWAASFALDISTDNLGLKILFMQIRFLGLPFVTLLLLIIAIRFTGHGSWLTRQRILLLSIIPAITTALAILTAYTPLLRYDYHIVSTSAGFTVLGFSNGLWSVLIYNPFTYASEIMAVLLLLWMVFSAEKIYSRQALLFFAAIIIPIFSEILFTLGVSPVESYDVTTSTFAITGTLLAIAIFRYRFIDVVPVARSTLFERMADPMLVIDPDGRLADFNAAAEEVLGLNRVQDLGKTARDSLREHKDLVAGLEQTGSVPGTITIGTGSAVRDFDLSVVALAPGPDVLPLKMVHLQDITDRRKAEEKLHETAEYLGKLVDYASAPIIVWNPDFTITRFNHAFERLTRRTEQEVIGQHLELLFPEESRGTSLTLIRNAMNGERWENVKIPVQAADGTVYTVLWNSANILTPGAELVSTIVQGIDITERERVWSELAATQQQYRELFENVNVGILRSTPGPEGILIEANPAVIRIFEAGSREEFLALRPRDLYADATERQRISDQIMASGSINGAEVRFRTLKGRQIWGRITAIKKTAPDGKIYFDNTIEDITDQKRTEDALKASEEQYRSLFDNLMEGYASCRMIYDEEGAPADFIYLRVNPAFDRIIGVPTVTGRRVTEVFPGIKEAFPQLFEIYGRVAVTGRPETFEIEFTPSGKWLHISVYSSQEEHFVAIFEDITEGKKAEQALRESEEKYREFFTTSRDCVFITSPEGSWIDFNNAAMEMFGYGSREEFARTTIRDLYAPPEQRAAFIARIEREGYVKEQPILLKRKDGLIIDTLITAVPLRHPDGSLKAFIGTIRDVTGQKKNEERIRWLASFPALNPNPVIEMDAQGTITFANEATRGTLQKLELPDNPAVFIPEDRDEILRLLRESSEPFIDREIVVKDQVYAETISLNRTLHVVRIYTHNITKQKHAEKHRERLLLDLEQKNAELERFTYTVSHDLKSPLITIRGFAGLVEADVERGDLVQLNKDLDRIATAADTMQELLTDLLELSRIGRITKPFERIGFGTIVRESAELLAGPLAERGSRIEVAAEFPEVYVDHARIRQVMNNLIENAIKFSGSRPDPVIRIGVENNAGIPVFFVHDNGIGINPRYLERIFNLFEKLDVSVPGTGIGLTTVRRIIEVHGGKIWAESEGIGKGTTFRFTLPGVPNTDNRKDQNAGPGA